MRVLTISTSAKKCRIRSSAFKRLFLLPVGFLLLLPALSSGQDKLDLSKLIFEEVLLTEAVIADNNKPPLKTSESEDAQEVDENDAALVQARTASIQQYQETINAADDGPFAAGLAEQFEAIGALQQENGEHEQAIIAFEEARQITRIEQGLFTLSQIPAVEGLITSYQALDDGENETQLREYLFYIQQKNYAVSEPRMLTIMQDWADWNVQFFLRNYHDLKDSDSFSSGINSIGSDYVEVIDRGTGHSCYVPRYEAMYSGSLFSNRGPSCTLSLSQPVQQAIVEPHLRLAQNLYEVILAQNNSLSDNDPTHPYSQKNIDLQHDLASVTFMIKTQMDSTSSRFDSRRLITPVVVEKSYRLRREAFQAIIDAQKAVPNPDPLLIALALMELADLNMAFNKFRAGSKAYTEVYSILLEAGKTEEQISTIMSSPTPLAVPAFSAHLYSRELQQIAPDVELNYKGYIDVKFNQDIFGRRDRVRVLASSPDTPQIIRRTLWEHLRKQNTRPTFIEGRAVPNNGIELRYYYSY